ncbi:MAG: FG-GAP-like repeat-containing protein [Planctomycetota bacterium]
MLRGWSLSATLLTLGPALSLMLSLSAPLPGQVDFGTPQQDTSGATGVNPISVAAADFDGDQILDLVVADYDASGCNCATSGNTCIRVLLGSGNGTFHSPAAYCLPHGESPQHLITADFNGDGSPDVAVGADGSPGHITILLNDGTGSCSTHSDYQVTARVWDLAAGDFDGDGNIDLVATDYAAGDAEGRLSIAFGDGTGALPNGFQVLRTLDGGVPGVDVGDFDGDGDLDIALSEACPSPCDTGDPGRVILLLGDGLGSFPSGDDQEIQVGTNPWGPSVSADFNGDNRTDVAVVNQGDMTISIILGSTPGNFIVNRTIQTGYSGNGFLAYLTAADYDLDQYVDLSLTVSTPGEIRVYRGDGGGGFCAGQAFSVGGGPNEHVPADFDGDGLPDLAAGTLGNPQDLWFLQNTTSSLPPPIPFFRGDVNGDGQIDVADAVYLLLYLFLPGSPAPVCLDSADMDDGGVLDIGDPIALLDYLFHSGGTPPAPPFPGCGVDPTSDCLVNCSYPQGSCPPP